MTSLNIKLGRDMIDFGDLVLALQSAVKSYMLPYGDQHCALYSLLYLSLLSQRQALHYCDAP